MNGVPFRSERGEGGGDPVQFPYSSLHSLFSRQGMFDTKCAVYLFVPIGVLINHSTYGSWSKNSHWVMLMAVLAQQQTPMAIYLIAAH